MRFAMLMVGLLACATASPALVAGDVPAMDQPRTHRGATAQRAGMIGIRLVHVGSFVERGQLLAWFGDEAAHKDFVTLAMKKAAWEVLQAELDAIRRTAEEAKHRVQSRIRIRDAAGEIAGAQATWQRYVAEVAANEALARRIELDFHNAKAIFAEQHEIRSPVRGQVISVRNSDWVRRGDTIIEIMQLD